MATTDVSVVFFDVGGVLGTNGWDRAARGGACARFDLDPVEFEDRHEFVADAFETGQLDLGEYLRRTVFYRDRPFTPDAFVEQMKAQSQPFPDMLAVVADLAAAGRCVLATLNNESRELNEFRIDRFGLRRWFHLFLSSCYVGERKPDERLFRLALDVTQTPASRALFVDDRELNRECARGLGLDVVTPGTPDEVRAELLRRGLLG